MDSKKFDNLISLLRRIDSHDDLMHQIQVAIGDSGLISTTQLNKLMTFFLSYLDKVELAEMAYGYVSETQSYDQIINKTFVSDQTKIHLNQYIRRH